MKLDRRNQIIDLITRQRTVKNSELMERFNISIETVRRDLEYLEQQGYLRRVYGGAVLNQSLSGEPEYASRAKVQSIQKAAIAAEAAKLVQNGDSIYMGVGTTVQTMARYLKNTDNLTVFTNAIRTAVELSDFHNCSVILSGGKLRPKELTLSGFPAEENMDNFNVDKAFIGIGGITDSAITDFHIDEAQIHRQLIRNARLSVVLADSSKLGIRGIVNLCKPEAVDIIITDSGADPQIVKELEQSGIQVLIANEE